MLKKKLVYLQIILIAIPLFFLAAFSFAENNGGNFRVTALPFSSTPKIDGTIENPVWEEGIVIDSFTQYEPQEGSEPTEKTVAYIGYDSKNLYIAVRAYDSDPNAVRACLTQRDSVYGDDVITVYLDTFFTTEANIDEKGYTVEMAIPFKSLRFPNTPNQVWGLQIMRNIQRKNEEIYWHPRSRDVNGFLIQAGTLEVQGQIEKGKNFEIMPVLTSLKAMSFNFSRQARHLTFSLDYNQIPEDFEASLGFFRRKDIRSLSTRVGYAFLPMNEYIVDIRPSLQYRRIHVDL